MKEILHAGAFAALAQSLLVAEDLGHRANHAHRLVGQDKGIQTDCEMRLVREAATDAQRVANFAVVLHRRRGQCR